MATTRYKTPGFNKLFDDIIANALDEKSEMYHNGQPRRGASHRCAFWDGYSGLTRTPQAVPGTMSMVCFQAGKQFAKMKPGIKNTLFQHQFK